MQRPQENTRQHALKRERARELRSQMTEAERKLWARLRGKKMAGLRFRRQETIGPYIADFYCSNYDFLRDPEVAVESIWRAIVDSKCPLPEPLCGSSSGREKVHRTFSFSPSNPQGEGGI
jgi:hypothetical protein